jgi:hypothetical protein
MEALAFALVAVLNAYRKREISVPEPAEFRPFDLKTLGSLNQNKRDHEVRSFDRKQSYVLQTARD